MQYLFNSRHLLASLALVLFGVAGCGGPEPPPVVDAATARLLMEGEEALSQGAFDQALRLADSAAVRMPDAVQPHFLRGLIYARIMKWDEAEAAYEQVRERDPSYRGLWNNLGNIALRQERLRDALQYFKRELALQPDPQPWISMGRAYRDLGQVDSAVFAFDQALHLDSTLVDAYLGHAQMAEEEGAFEEGLTYARKAFELGNQNPQVRYVLGLLLAKSGKDEAAIPHLQEVTRIWPWHTESHYSLAQALQRVGRDEESRDILAQAEKLWQRQAEVSYFQKTVSNDPENPYNYAALATSFRMAGRYNDAVDAYKIALTLEPANLEFQNNLASLYFLQKDTLTAIKTYQSILEQDEKMISAWLNLGILLALSGKRDAAQTAWRNVLAQDPSNQQARAYLARLEQERKR